jgi:hypothetical protein
MAAPRKKRTKNASLSADEVQLPKAEQINIDQLFAQALTRHKNEALVDKKLKIKELHHFSSMAGEYLNCFIMIGYSLQDEKVVLLNMPTPKDEAALIDLLRSTFLDLASDRP